MKRYNLSSILKKAHNFNKLGKYTWSECLKKSWKSAKFDAWVADQKVIMAKNEAIEIQKKEDRQLKAQIQSILLKAELEAQRLKTDAKAEANNLRMERSARIQGKTLEEYQNNISYQMGYGRGTYCGD